MMRREDSWHRRHLSSQWGCIIQLLFALLVWIVGTTLHHPVDAELRFETTHKMGVLLTVQFMKRFRDITNGTTGKGEPGVIIPPNVTVPSVIVVRDLLDATVSGYLYHKSGRECWLNVYGGPPRRRGEHMANHNWTKHVSTVPIPQDIRFPQKKNICKALEHTTETVGMGIYLEFARNNYYRTAVQLKHRTHDPTLFVCFEELMNWPDEMEARVRSFYNEFQTHNTTIIATFDERVHPQVGRRLQHDDVQSSSWHNNSQYSGGHATNHDPELRTRLRQIAMELDCIYFGCETKAWSDSLNCTSEVDRRNNTKLPNTAPATKEDEEGVKMIEAAHFKANDTPGKPNLIHLMQWVVIMGIFWLRKRIRPMSHQN